MKRILPRSGGVSIFIFKVQKRLIARTIRHQVDQHPGDVDIHPDGQRPAGDFAVGGESAFKCAAQGDDRKHWDGDDDDGMGRENGQINRAHGA